MVHVFTSVYGFLFSFLSVTEFTEANKFYDRNHQLFDAALLTRCNTQHAVRPFIDSEINHKRHFIKIPFINKGIEFVDLPSVFKDRSVTSSIPAYFQNSEPPIICYKYNKPIRNTVFNFNKLVSDLDIHANTPESWDCKDSKFMYPAAGHIMTGSLKIISDSRIRYIVSKGPKYRFPSRVDFKKCREEIASALNDFSNRWCKREYVEPDVLKEWKVSIFKIVDQRIKFYSQNTNLLPPKPKSTFRHLKQGIGGSGVRLNDGPDIKLFILVGLGRSFFVCCLAHRGSTVGFLLLQCSSGVVRHPRDLQVSVATHFCRVLIFASS